MIHVPASPLCHSLIFHVTQLKISARNHDLIPTKQIRKRCVRPLAASNERPESNERCLCQWLARIVCRRWYEDEIFTFASFHLWEASNPVVPVGHQCQRGNTPLNRSTFTVVATLYNRLFTDYISNLSKQQTNNKPSHKMYKSELTVTLLWGHTEDTVLI